jgi:hypothetical protein
VGYGGPTWDTAGTLTLGSDNTFDVADTTLDTDGVYDQAWWKFTGTALKRVNITASSYGFLKVYTGASFAAKVEVVAESADPVGATVDTQAVEYHVLLGRGQFDPPLVTYQLTREQAQLTASPWIDDLTEAPEEDNILIVSNGDIIDDNPNPGFSTLFMPEWTFDVIRGGQSRTGNYRLMEMLGGSPITSAMGCAFSHAVNGEQAVVAWNATGEPPDPTPAMCLPLEGAGADAEVGGTLSSTHVELNFQDNSGIPFTASYMEAILAGPSHGIWYLPVRDNLNPWGTLFGSILDTLDPEAHGYPADADVEWETPYVELVRVELTDGDPLTSSSAPFTNRWVLHDPVVAPTWEDGYTTPWKLGIVGTSPMVDPPPERPFLLFDYADGDPEWHELPNSEGWDGHDWNEDYADLEPADSDSLIIAWPTDTPSSTDFNETRLARIAVKFVLRAPRFRFIYEGSPVVRQWPRDDARGVSSAPRLRPPSKTQRIAGGYPGGSNA